MQITDHNRPASGGPSRASASVVSTSASGVPARYSNWQRIGRGGSADVFKVTDTVLEIELAIKVLRKDQPRSKRNQDFMRREVLVSRALRHTAICPVHDIYDGPEGFGVIMDLLVGMELSDWVAANESRQIETFDARVSMLLQIADALSVAHRRIVHRDLKPANIFLMEGDIERPLILDFGLSLLDESVGSGLRGGTPRYMAPEQFDGAVDLRSDLFAFGVIAYELLTGAHPLGKNRPRKIGKADWLGARITPPSQLVGVIPPGLDRLLARMLDVDPARRPQSAAEIVRTMHAILEERTRADRATGETDRLPDVSVPGGDYLIGSPPSSRHAAEKPMRRISLSGFRLTETPVTNSQYLAFVRDTGAVPPPLIDHMVFGRPDHPVVMLDWHQAKIFCEWAGGRLPTEAEWEVAAKAGARMQDYPWGNQQPSAASANFDSGVGATTPVKAYPEGRNDLGLWDMAGNVAEWCQDGFSEQAYRQLREGSQNPCHGETLNNQRVIRGGGYEGMAHLCRVAFRTGAEQGTGRRDIGFRVAFDGQ